ncbi:MAG: hypothetical protein IT555_10770 [Acetobacteraceae bacterium]|nr:hypothetical protein [Acetobacteraceae bacterium]
MRDAKDGNRTKYMVGGDVKAGDQQVVTFTRKLAGGAEDDITLAAGNVCNLGFAIHDDHAAGRFHHVSLGYTLGLGADADIKAVKQ